MKTKFYCGTKSLLNSILFMMALTFLLSCIKKEDLSDLTFPIETGKLLKGVDYKEDEFIYDKKLEKFSVKNFSDFTLYGKSYDKQLFENAATYSGKNHLYFIGTSKEINGYYIGLYTRKESESLEESLFKELGKPNYENIKSFEKKYIWETPQKIYILRIGLKPKFNNIETRSSEFFCLNTKLVDLKMYKLSSTTDYGDYIEQREKLNKSLSEYPYSTYKKEKEE